MIINTGMCTDIPAFYAEWLPSDLVHSIFAKISKQLFKKRKLRKTKICFHKKQCERPKHFSIPAEFTIANFINNQVLKVIGASNPKFPAIRRFSIQNPLDLYGFWTADSENAVFSSGLHLKTLHKEE